MTEALQKNKRDRSTAYPSISLEQALEYSQMLVEAYRKNPFSRQTAVEGIGYKKITGDTAQKVAALNHYGLLERSGTSAYCNTQLAQDICYPTSDEERTKDVALAAHKPKLFHRLIVDHVGQSLPSRLKNILIQPHGITPTVAEKVAENFKKTLEYAGLLPNGVVTTTIDLEEELKPTSVQDKSKKNTHQIHPSTHQTDVAPQKVTLPAGTQSLTLPCGVTLTYPTEMAYLFAIGKFAEQITALNEAIILSQPKENNENGTETSITNK